jgi:hypothetical protein
MASICPGDSCGLSRRQAATGRQRGDGRGITAAGSHLGGQAMSDPTPTVTRRRARRRRRPKPSGRGAQARTEETSMTEHDAGDRLVRLLLPYCRRGSRAAAVHLRWPNAVPTLESLSRQRHGRAGQPEQRRPARPVGRVEGSTTWPGRCSMTRRSVTSHWPASRRGTTSVTWNSADLEGATPVVSVSGWNVPKIDILAYSRS